MTDVLPSPVLAYLRGTSRQPVLICTEWLIFLSCRLHLQKKVTARKGTSCTGGSIPGATEKDLLVQCLSEFDRGPAASASPGNTLARQISSPHPNLLSRKPWGAVQLSAFNRPFPGTWHPLKLRLRAHEESGIPSPRLLMSQETLNAREARLGLRHWGPHCNHLSLGGCTASCVYWFRNEEQWHQL